MYGMLKNSPAPILSSRFSPLPQPGTGDVRKEKLRFMVVMAKTTKAYLTFPDNAVIPESTKTPKIMPKTAPDKRAGKMPNTANPMDKIPNIFQNIFKIILSPLNIRPVTNQTVGAHLNLQKRIKLFALTIRVHSN